MKGKPDQMAWWGSDQLIVVRKQGNACGAKGLASEPRSRETPSGHGTGQRETTELDSMTHSIEGEEVHLKSRMQEICTSGSVRGLVVDSARSWPRGLLDRGILSSTVADGNPLPQLQTFRHTMSNDCHDSERRDVSCRKKTLR